MSINPNDPINPAPEPSTLAGAATGVLMLVGYSRAIDIRREPSPKVWLQSE